MPEKIGFVGVGRMGANMARRLKECGYEITRKTQGLSLPLAAATRKHYDRMVREGLGELDKSGIAELTFKGRGQPTRLAPSHQSIHPPIP